MINYKTLLITTEGKKSTITSFSKNADVSKKMMSHNFKIFFMKGKTLFYHFVFISSSFNTYSGIDRGSKAAGTLCPPPHNTRVHPGSQYE